MIEIKCSVKDKLSISDLSTFQGDLKTLSIQNYKKVKKNTLT